MPPKPSTTFIRADPDREYLVLLTELPSKRWRDLGVLLLYTWRIQRQLRRASGLLGHSLLARLSRKQFLTLPVWEGEGVLQQLVADVPHVGVMKAFRAKIARPRFIRWSIRGDEIPPDWHVAFEKRNGT